ncbi:MAG: recombinase zinc beta ribbon domain-containing protein [Christensenellaceae bacterium]|nr:recombinase zinc beta ribbon domain-containing protein [Christensenellaceae bacterium]
MQERLHKNKCFAGGSSIARVVYYLSGKVFCGHCCEAMVGDGSTSKSKGKHYYYTCKKKKKRPLQKMPRK